MSLVPITEMLQQATADKYGVAAFNVENMEFVQGVMAAVSELKLPVVLQTTPSTLGYAGIGMFRDMVLQAMDQFGVKTPVALHLDHGSSFELACRAVRGGYSSVMIDGSQLPLEENIALTRRVVDVAHACGVSVEAELGSIGGKEDDLVIDKAGMTDPETAVKFVAASSCDALAVAIGTAHGLYKGEPHLDLERLRTIRSMVDLPLVLHGTSGVPDDTVVECIGIGVSKVNYATDLRVAFTGAMRESLTAAPDKFDPKVHLKAAREAVKKTAMARMTMLSCGNC
jgi:tagatose 1,6-diphosphate aldolase GatY/KbaY